jgi:hypothetical protein
MHEAHSYFVLAAHFLRLAEGTAHKLVKTRNRISVVSGGDISVDCYARETRWSDHSIGIAVMFSFYHGIELTLKGCLLLNGVSKQTHRLSKLFEDFEQKHAGSELAVELSQHIVNISFTSPLGCFLKENNIKIDSWYQSLKYPKSTNGKNFSHWKLQYGGTNTIEFWHKIKKSAKRIRKAGNSFLP